MSRLCLYYIPEREHDRWLPGDRYIRPLVRRIVRGTPRPGGVDSVFINLCLGLDKLDIEYEVNLPFSRLARSDRVGVLGRGRACLKEYSQVNPVVAGIGVMTHPSEWPTLCEEYPVVKYLQHSIWANDVYRPYFGERCTIWAVGIDTDAWRPAVGVSKSIDLLIYNKIRWDYERRSAELLGPIREIITQRKLSYRELRYGYYSPQEYRVALNQSRAMIFLCEHESQGIACQECLSSNVPVLAWDPGECLDPNRFKWGMPHIPATSVPYWDERCGFKFKNAGEFEVKLDEFLDKLNSDKFAPRDYIMENLTLEKCALHYLQILDEAQA